jgi:hypothetical protein
MKSAVLMRSWFISITDRNRLKRWEYYEEISRNKRRNAACEPEGMYSNLIMKVLISTLMFLHYL